MDRANSDPLVELEKLWAALFQQRKTFLRFFGATLVVTAIGTALTPKEYQATALVQLLPRAGREVEGDAVVQMDEAGYLERRDHARTQIQVLLARSTREAALARYHDQGGAAFPDAAEGVGWLKDHLTAAPREDTQLVEVKVTHADPKTAADLANAVVEVYRDQNLDLRRDAAREASGWIEGQSAQYKSALDDASARVMAFKESHDVADIEETIDGVSARLGSLQQALAAVTTERVIREGSVREHERLLERGDASVLATMYDDPAIAAMAREYAVLVTRSADVLARYGELHPDHQRAVEQIEGVERLMAEEVVRNLAAERSDVSALRRQEAQLDGEIAAVKVELLAKDSLTNEYLTLKAEEDQARALYTSLGARGAEVDLQARTRLNDVRVVDVALPPGQPSRPNVLLNLVMGLVVGAGGGAGLALWRNRRDHRVRTTADLVETVDVPVLGVIPTLPADLTVPARAFYVVEHPRSRHAEAFRGVRSMLDLSRTTHRALLVTSSLEGEGKTDTAIGLAATYARLGAKTLLVDGDLRLPRVHDVFDLPRAPGLADALMDPKRPMRHGRATHVPNLFVLPAGSAVDTPNELLASGLMQALLPMLSALYDVIVVDSPPVAVVTDPLTLARIVDGTILVVRRDRVPPHLVADSLGRLRTVGAQVVGVVLNDVPLSESAPYGKSRYYEEDRLPGPSEP